MKNPGMYEMPAGSRAQEAIEKAGGMTLNANVNKVNLAKKCKDGMQINVPALSVKQAKQGWQQPGEKISGEREQYGGLNRRI